MSAPKRDRRARRACRCRQHRMSESSSSSSVRVAAITSGFKTARRHGASRVPAGARDVQARRRVEPRRARIRWSTGGRRGNEDRKLCARRVALRGVRPGTTLIHSAQRVARAGRRAHCERTMRGSRAAKASPKQRGHKAMRARHKPQCSAVGSLGERRVSRGGGSTRCDRGARLACRGKGCARAVIDRLGGGGGVLPAGEQPTHPGRVVCARKSREGMVPRRARGHRTRADTSYRQGARTGRKPGIKQASRAQERP